MTLAWFGPRWAAGVCDELPEAPAPIGDNCLHCRTKIMRGEPGVLMAYTDEDGPSQRPLHRACFFRQTMGGANHLRKVCTCCGGNQPPDPPELSLRDAALLAEHVWRKMNMRPEEPA